VVKVSAPSKVILFGEHAVVYDKLGVAAAIDRRVRINVEKAKAGLEMAGEWKMSAEEMDIAHKKFLAAMQGKDIEALRGMNFKEAFAVTAAVARAKWGGEGFIVTRERSDPVKGTGGSAASFAAIAAGIAKLAGKEPSREEISAVAYAGDCVAHGGMPSGIDNTVVSMGGYLSYRKSEGLKLFSTSFSAPIVVVNTKEAASTRQMVAGVMELKTKKPGLAEGTLRLMEETAAEGLKALKDGDMERIGKLMFVNHELLRTIGVSTAKLDRVVELAREMGALGAKLTGAGGGGCAIVLPADAKHADMLAEMYRRAGFDAFTAQLGAQGVRLED